MATHQGGATWHLQSKEGASRIDGCAQASGRNIARRAERNYAEIGGGGFLMLTDRYGLALSTASAAAQDAYVQASELALTFYPGAAEAYDRALAADPGFALA